MTTDEPPTAALADLLAGALSGDIESLVFTVLMEAAKSAEEDLKQIMAGVKAINAAKQRQRETLKKIQRDAACLAAAELGGTKPKLAKNGLGGAAAYRCVPVAVPDADAAGAVRIVEVDFLGNRTVTRDEVQVAVDQIKNDLDSMSELGEIESLRLQMAMDRRSKMLETLSNILKKMSDTQQTIVQNLK